VCPTAQWWSREVVRGGHQVLGEGSYRVGSLPVVHYASPRGMVDWPYVLLVVTAQSHLRGPPSWYAADNVNVSRHLLYLVIQKMMLK
jgi:hypothetical protein